MPIGFDARAYVPRDLYDGITDMRVRQPGFADAEADRRARRRVAAPDGRLVILAADQPGRASLEIQDDPLAMADRHELLARIVRVLSHAGIDGFMSTPDIVEDLLILGGLIRERGGQNPLDERLLIGCMNRGGLPGTVWEMDDSFTAFTTRRMVVLGLDGGKVTLRIDPTDRSSSLATIAGSVRAVTELAEANLLAFLEPLPVGRENGAYKVVRTPRALAEAVSVASAMGASSLYTWLKLPTCPDFEQVARATTLPLVILGGEAVGDPGRMIEDLRRGLAAGPNVRGAMIGRNVLYPGADDPRTVAAAVSAVVHDGAGVDEALAAMKAERGKDPELV
ncbi:MAG: Cgl0159 family (beta/alpha)8-fold protein [Candidatus Rokuibacteriota bacterium]